METREWISKEVQESRKYVNGEEQEEAGENKTYPLITLYSIFPICKRGQ